MDQIRDELLKFKPDLVFFSSGFDAHEKDVSQLGTLEVEDYRELTIRLLSAAQESGAFSVVSVLEGGYGRWCDENDVGKNVARLGAGQTLDTFGDCLREHLKAMVEAHSQVDWTED